MIQPPLPNMSAEIRFPKWPWDYTSETNRIRKGQHILYSNNP